MKSILMRPSSALFPLALLAAAVLGRNAAACALFFAYCVMQLLSLCAAESFRNAAAREPGVRRVDKRFSGAFLQTALGILLGTLICHILFQKIGAETPALPICAAAGCIVTEQLFEERMFALSHPHDGVILSILANLLLLAGMLLDGSGGIAAPMREFFPVCGAALGMLISIIAAYCIEPMHAFSLRPVNIAFFPKAAVQTLLYPLIAAGLCGFGAPLFAGHALWRLSRTVCRRARDESWSLNCLLIFVCGGMIVGSAFMGELYSCAFACLLALLCAIIIYCAPGWRLYAGSALLIAAWILCKTEVIQNIPLLACSLIAVLLNLHRAFLRKI